ncbi:MAG: hypothetical protein Q8L35_06735 [Actinomycetota bacterium]|nr:hypothetical protein [Actinomycetota bacterium]
MKKIAVILVASLLLMLAATASSPGRDRRTGGRRVIVIVANGISTGDIMINGAPNIKKSLRSRAAIGLMNARAAKSAANASGSYLSIGAGARANAGRFGNLAVDRGETLLFQGIPQKLPLLRAGGRVVSPSYPEMSRLATKLSYQAAPGTLGDLLRLGGIKRSVFGNADTLGVYHREINLIAMDKKGSTDFGNVAGPINTPAQALTAVDAGLKNSQFLVLEYAPTSRVDFRRDFLSDDAVASQRRQLLLQVDRLFGKLLARYADNRTMIILITPSPPIELAKSGALQTPLVVAGPGFKGLLTSTGTRWPGLVTNSDIAPTILNFFGLSVPTYLPGRTLTSEPSADPPAIIDHIAQKALVNNGARSILLSSYITVAVAAIIAVVLVLLFWPPAARIVYLQPLLLGLMFMPVVMLISSSAVYPTPWLPIILIPAATLICALVTWLLWRDQPLLALVVPSLLTTLIILVQLPFGSILERDSVMGMSSIIGARFYGIGNEYTGVLLGSAVICLTVWLTLRPRSRNYAAAAAAILFIVITLIVGWPTLGANVGGALAAVTTGIVATFLFRDTRLAAKHLFYVAIGMVAVLAVILITDYLEPSSSHTARAATLVGGGGMSQALMIITRKLSTNFMLITRSSWTKIIVAAVAAVATLQLGARQIYDHVYESYGLMPAGFKTIALGAVAALIFNDSGVVMAALMLIYAICGWLYLMIFSTRSSASPKP